MRIALVGFGKVGQAIFKAAKKYRYDRQGLEIVAVVDSRFGQGLNPPKGAAVFSENRRTQLPWDYFALDLVIEASGAAVRRKSAREHLRAGAQRVLVTASMPDPDVTLIAGANEIIFNPAKHHIISASSCTTVCVAPLLGFLMREFRIESARINIRHGYNPGNIAADVDFARITDADARAKFSRGEEVAYQTNFARNTEAVLPFLSGKLTAESYYMPVNRVLFIQADLRLEGTVSAEEINARIAEASEKSLSGILKYVDSSDPACSIIPGNRFSSLFLPQFTQVEGSTVYLYVGGDYIWGYAVRVLDLITHLAMRGLAEIS
jgi:glyceraldehyde 3-phosphate dehydrogenase